MRKSVALSLGEYRQVGIRTVLLSACVAAFCAAPPATHTTSALPPPQSTGNQSRSNVSPGRTTEGPLTSRAPKTTGQTGSPMSSRAIVAPRPLPRCTTQPDQPFWSQRDIFKEIQGMARRGAIAVTPVQDDVKEFTGFSDFPAGWRAFGFRVPAKEQIHIRLRHPNEGWFRLSMVGKWGTVEEGMLRNLIPTGNPEVKFVNPSGKTRVVYVIVDDPGWMSNQKSPFSMTVARSWDPAVKKVDDSQIVTGIWAQKKEDAKPSVEPAKPQVSSVVSKG